MASGDDLTPAEIAAEFGVSTPTVRRWDAKGWLRPYQRLPGSGWRRYRRADVEEFRRRYDAGEFPRPSHGKAAELARPPERGDDP